MMQITLPYQYQPREYQKEFLIALDSGKRRAILLWCRRSGKDKTALNYMIKSMLERVGVYYYCLPKYNQARKVIWENIDKSGFRFIDHFPKELIKSKNDQQMTIELVNGSVFRLIGADEYNTVVGTNPVGMVFSEYALQDPRAWGYFRPILAENNGYAIFVYTPRGKNHGYKLYENAKADERTWYVSKKTVEDTNILTKEALETERREMFAETGDDNLFYQEYYCDFNSPTQGAYYAKYIQDLEEQGKIRDNVYDPALQVETWWDIGVDDYTAIWFTQTLGNEVRVIDYYEGNNKGLPDYIKFVRELPYIYKRHNAPHDIKVKEFTTGRTRLETARNLGIEFNVGKKLPVIDGINAVRLLLPRCVFDKKKCEFGIEALLNYHREYDEEKKIFKENPEHDWSSHGADAFRYLAVGHEDEVEYSDPNIIRTHNYNNSHNQDSW